jgi:uncharacterized membrane protein
MDLPNSSHFIYIPVILVLGIVLGFVMGARTTREQLRIDQQRTEERARRKEERRRAAGGNEGHGAAERPEG